MLTWCLSCGYQKLSYTRGDLYQTIAPAMVMEGTQERREEVERARRGGLRG